MNIQDIKTKYGMQQADASSKGNYGVQQNINVGDIRANAKQAVLFAEKILKRCKENLEKASKMKSSDPVVNTQRAETNLRILASAEQNVKALLILK